MSDYNRETSDYEPNFILQPDPREETPSPDVPAKAGGSVQDPQVTEVIAKAEKVPAEQPESITEAEAKEAAPVREPDTAAGTAEISSQEPQPAGSSETEPQSDSAEDDDEMMTYLFGESFREAVNAGAKSSETADQPKSPSSEQSAGAPFGAASSGTSGNSRPKYENPSFDAGRTGSYTDPRDNFRYGESASWSNGEMKRNKKAVRDSIRRQKKTSQPVTLSKRALGLLIAGCMVLSCLFGMGGAAIGNALTGSGSQTTEAPVQAQTAASTGGSQSAGYSLESATGSNMTVKEITAAAKSSVVEIRTESVRSDSWMQEYVTEGAGSGVIISKDGYIMTNNHVIEGASKIKVTTADGKEYQAKMVGTDETNDVAVIKVEGASLTPATYGNSDQLEVGDLAVAIGNPLGELGGTVTAGIISATDRELSIDGKTLHLLQTDSSINPGNSGGGLFNGDGQLVGLVVAKSAGSDVEGLGFAIPINTAANVAQQLIDKGYVSGQPSTGMTYQQVAAGGGSYGSFDSLFGGSPQAQVVIYSVNGDNAKKAGFQAGDIVYKVDGEEITDFNALSSIITAHKVGDKLDFTVIRDGSEVKLKLELEEKQASQNSSSNQNSQQQNGQNDQGQNGGQQAPDQNGQNDQGQNGWQDMPQQPGSSDQSDSWQDWFSMFF